VEGSSAALSLLISGEFEAFHFTSLFQVSSVSSQALAATLLQHRSEGYLTRVNPGTLTSVALGELVQNWGRLQRRKKRLNNLYLQSQDLENRRILSFL